MTDLRRVSRIVRPMGEFTDFGRHRLDTAPRRCRKCNGYLSLSNPGDECFSHSYVEQDEISILQLMGAE